MMIQKEWPNYLWVEQTLQKKNYQSILYTPEFFWLLFCKVSAESSTEKDQYFCPSLTDKKIVVSGKNHIILAMQEGIEAIRKIFALAHGEKRNFVLLAIDMALFVFFREAAPTIDLKNWLLHSVPKTNESWYKDYILPHLEGLCAGIGAACKATNVTATIESDDDAYTKKYKGFAVSWIPAEHLVYPIPPHQVPLHAPLEPSLYDLYEQQKFCDFTIQTRDGAIKTHAAVLYVSGGAVIQQMLSSPMSESTTNTLCLKQFSLNAVRAFLAFLYVGKAGLDPQEFEGHERILLELYEMAELYQIQPLIDCCTNLMSLLIHDPALIEPFSPYNNAHLKQLHAHLLTQKYFFL